VFCRASSHWIAKVHNNPQAKGWPKRPAPAYNVHIHNESAAMNVSVVYVVDRETPAFERDRLTVDVVCAGDSLTGWNNFGPVHYWPYPTTTNR